MYYRGNRYREDLKSVLNCVESIYILKQSSVLITGASGLIGSFLVDFLMYCNEVLSLGIDIYVMGRNVSSLSRRFSSHLHSEHFHIIQHDVTTPFTETIHVDYIIHAASNAYPQLFSIDPVGTITSNVFGTYYLLEYLKSTRGKRFLFVSSGEVYGLSCSGGNILDELSYGYVNITDPRSCYPNAKRVTETLCVSYAKQYGVDTVIARPCHIYGPTATLNDNRVSSQFIRNALKGNDLVLKSHGTQLRSYCYVADCVSGILTVLLKGITCNAYNISNIESVVTIREMADIIAEICGVKVCFELPNDEEKAVFNPMMDAVLDSTKLRALGWNCMYNIREGLSRTIGIMRDLMIYQ